MEIRTGCKERKMWVNSRFTYKVKYFCIYSLICYTAFGPRFCPPCWPCLVVAAATRSRKSMMTIYQGDCKRWQNSRKGINPRDCLPGIVCLRRVLLNSIHWGSFSGTVAIELYCIGKLRARKISTNRLKLLCKKGAHCNSSIAEKKWGASLLSPI